MHIYFSLIIIHILKLKPDLLTDDSEVTERSKAIELEITEG